MHRHLLLLLCLLTAPVLAQPADSVAARQQAVEAGLLPAVVVAGAPEPTYTLYERMAHYGVPGVSIAVIDDGYVAWAAGYGVKQAGGADSVTTSTLFQAASISKPVAAAAALRLVEQGRLDLDGDVNARLQSWHLPANKYTEGQPVTLRHLLTHTGGLTVHGFPGYAAGEAVPSAVAVLDGAGNTAAVRADTIPGAIWRYSGGGYTVAQVLVEDAAGAPFAAVMAQEVLYPLGMYRSTYVQPLPGRLAGDAAVGHRAGSVPVAGRWHTYPEQAAAGLWATPTDLARFALGLRSAYLGAPGAILQQATAQQMLSEHRDGYGLGVGVAGAGDSLRFSHGGANEGYRAYFVLYPATGDGVAVMTNADSGSNLGMEVVRAVARVYDWPDFQPEARPVVEVAPAVLDRLEGTYRFIDEPDYAVVVERAGDDLYLTLPSVLGGQRVRLWPASETAFFVEDAGTRVIFEPDGTPGLLEMYGERAKRAE